MLTKRAKVKRERERKRDKEDECKEVAIF